MNILRILPADTNSQLMNDLLDIYVASLPVHEQKPVSSLRQMLRNPNYYFHVLVENNQTIGFAIIYSSDADYCLLEYIAIDSGCRNGGYGGKLLNNLMQIFADKTMIIEIDSPFEESADKQIRHKRMEFYLRQGCYHVDGLKYILPLENKNVPEMLVLLNFPTSVFSISKEKLLTWISHIYVDVYGCDKGDLRIYKMFENLPDQLKLTDKS